MKIVIAGGGTGGHIFPALSIAESIKQLDPHTKIIFAGNLFGMEEGLVKQAGYDFFALKTSGLLGKSLWQKAKALWNLCYSIMKALPFLLHNKPDLVLGVGGHVSAPIVMAAFLLRIKIGLCEQNGRPGLTNRWLAKLADAVFVTFPNSAQFFPPKKVVVSGNPTRTDFFKERLEQSERPFTLLVVGGSQGAHILNTTVPKTLAQLMHEGFSFHVIHQTGPTDFALVEQTYRDVGISANVYPFIHDMPRMFQKADIAISRAGASMCCELNAAGLPAILIPYPLAHGHQEYNALELVEKGAAVMISQKNLNENALAEAIKKLYKDSELRNSMILSSKKMAKPDAALVIARAALTRFSSVGLSV